jgi:hypothetical protein
MKTRAESYTPEQQALIPPSGAIAPTEALERAPQTIYQVLGDLARDPNVDVTRIAALMELQIKAEDRQAEKEFNAAFARLQPTLPRISKNGVIDMGNKGKIYFSKYEDLDSAIRHLYIAEGFSLSFISEPSDKGIVLVAVLAHAAGHQKTSRLQLPPDAGAGRNALQALGSSLSYAKRYLTCDLFNIVTVDQDKDGTSPADSLSQEQIDSINDLLHEIGAEGLPKLCKFMDVEAVKDIQQGAYAPAMNFLQALRRQIGARAK